MTIPHVYLGIRSDGIYKIGWSRNPPRRMNDLISECKTDVRLVCSIQTEYATWLEHFLHSRFSPKFFDGEWFRLDNEDVAYICGITVETVEHLYHLSSGKKSTKIDADLFSKIKIIATTNGEPAWRYLHRLLLEVVSQDYPKALKKLNDEMPPA